MLKGVAVVLGTALAVRWAFKEKDHTHPNGFGAFDSGRLVEVVVEQDGKFYEVWGLVCECGFVEPEGFVGANPTVGPATGWTHDNVTELQLGLDMSPYRDHIIDVRSEKFKKSTSVKT